MDEPAVPRPAATVILLRRSGRHRERGLEVLMLRRGSEARFMPERLGLPGRRRRPRATTTSPRALELEVELEELAHRVCGARELGEEASIPLEAHALRPWSRWVTPEVVPIRFDTRFYVALAPAHSKPEPDRSEVDEARWLTPAGALDEHAAGGLELSFPTVRHLEELTGFPDADAVLAEGESRRVEAITPKVRGDRENFEVLLPGDPGFAEA